MVTPALIWTGFEPQARALSKRARKRFERSVKSEIAAQDQLGLTACALGIEAPPAAALSRLADGLAAEDRNWLLAEPVVLLPDRDALALLPLTAAPLAREEEEALVAVARAHFGDELTLERGSSGRWYAAIEAVRQASGAPLEACAGRALDTASLASGPDAAPLRAFLTELQMLWYEHPVNQARRADGRPEANALWLWGGGYLPAKPPVAVPAALRANALELAGLALWLGIEHLPLAEPAEGEPRDGAVVAVGAEDVLGEAWLERFFAWRGPFRIYAAGNEWQVPARGGLSGLPGAGLFRSH